MTATNHREYSQGETLIYLHISKSGGSTIGSVIDRQYPNENLYVAHLNAENDTFVDLPEDYRANLQCFRGITFYGIHQYIPRPYAYATILRHPVDRVISQYFYNQRRRVREGVEVKREKSLDELLEHPDFKFHTYLQLNSIIGGDRILSTVENPLPNNALEIAKAHIEQDFVVAGTLPRYDETLVLMKQIFGWGNIYYGFRNRGINKDIDKISASTRKRLEQLCEPEIEFYEWVSERFEQRLKAQSQRFWQVLFTFRRRNAVYGSIWHYTRRVRQTSAWRTLRHAVAPTWKAPDKNKHK